ncbi:hypothetical protein WJ0W_001431 [Paenibacillus melissococcoides]|uniref:Uncharacterized protein n=1 Tax=Paenibacillus melissococcoides TaxID=2912268 RepID=A0ABM9FZ65_9BACL|nr:MULTISPECIES: hypothetical protein [Paenibacillus]MEB9893661.1 hypothetical protein [Bacillus cereus]CAH8244193.1 hypothetical protein WJ0W_001431 [Paenibacillus melissococcoides]CAH8703683.1 hypothetical protein HTL2_000232 [Paenibacillus melissococcoides]CAH8706179.1 hypothetical protein WDD9_001194 [Paenibacillus melissococcoides]
MEDGWEQRNPAPMQEVTLFAQLFDEIPAKVHQFRRFLLSIHWYGGNSCRFAGIAVPE